MAGFYVPDGLQSFAAMAIFVLIFAVPLYNIIIAVILHARPENGICQVTEGKYRLPFAVEPRIRKQGV